VTWRAFEGYGHILFGRNGALLNWLAKEGADSVP